MRPFQPHTTGSLLSLLAVVVVGFAGSDAQAACNWKFDWYCSDCAKIGGRTTGEQGGYPNEAVCEAARSSVQQPVTAGSSCDRVGWCDEPEVTRPTPPPGGSRGGGRDPVYRAPPLPDYAAEEEARRQEEARQAVERERKARERAAFEKARTELLDQLKGSTLDQDSGLKGTAAGDTLELKSGTPTFGIKSNPGGTLRLKDPNAVPLKNPDTAAVDPAFFTRPKARLRIRAVPNPLAAPKGTWLRYVKSERAALVLDALEEGKGDLDRAIAWLDGQVTLHGSNVKASSALSYLEGLRTSFAACDAEYGKLAKAASEPVTLEANLLLAAVLEQSDPRKWPGSKNPNPQASKNDWRVQRTTAVLQALEENPGNLDAAFERLQTARDRETVDNAEHYLRGVYAYWDYLGQEGRR